MCLNAEVAGCGSMNTGCDAHTVSAFRLHHAAVQTKERDPSRPPLSAASALRSRLGNQSISPRSPLDTKIRTCHPSRPIFEALSGPPFTPKRIRRLHLKPGTTHTFVVTSHYIPSHPFPSQPHCRSLPRQVPVNWLSVEVSDTLFHSSAYPILTFITVYTVTYCLVLQFNHYTSSNKLHAPSSFRSQIPSLHSQHQHESDLTHDSRPHAP